VGKNESLVSSSSDISKYYNSFFFPLILEAVQLKQQVSWDPLRSKSKAIAVLGQMASVKSIPEKISLIFTSFLVSFLQQLHRV
jgi:hypothetical protein